MRRVKPLSFLFFILFAHGSCLHAQLPPSIQWGHCFGGSLADFGYSIIEANGHGDGKYVIAGATTSNDGDVYGSHGGISNSRSNEAWIVGCDNSGILWQSCLGGSGAEAAQSIIATSDGGYAACGWTTSNDGDFLGYHGGGDAWVAKLDMNGKLVWGKCFGGSGEDGAYSIIESNDEGRDLVICGYTNSTDGDVYGLHTDSSKNKNPDVWVIRLSQRGDIRWQKCYGGTGSEETISEYSGVSIIQTKDGGFAFAASTNSNDGDVSGNHLDSAGHTTEDFWVVKLDGIGNMKWQKCLGGSSIEVPASIIQTIDSGYVVVGWTQSNDGDISRVNTNTDGWVVKLNSSGLLQWQKCFGGSLSNEASLIIQTSDGDYIIAGSTSSYELPGFHGGDDAWVFRLGDDGKTIKWQECYGGSKTEYAKSLIKTSDGGYIFTGQTVSNDGDVFDNHASGFNGDMWVVKLNPDTGKASVQAGYTTAFAQNFVRIYPNPASSEVQFSVSNLSVNSVGFYDVMGRQHFPKFTLENNTISCDVHDLSNGIYMARLNWTGRINFQNQDYPGSFSVPFIVQH